MDQNKFNKAYVILRKSFTEDGMDSYIESIYQKEEDALEHFKSSKKEADVDASIIMNNPETVVDTKYMYKVYDDISGDFIEIIMETWKIN